MRCPFKVKLFSFAWF